MKDHETEKKPQQLTHNKALTLAVQNQIPFLIMYINSNNSYFYLAKLNKPIKMLLKNRILCQSDPQTASSTKLDSVRLLFKHH